MIVQPAPDPAAAGMSSPALLLSAMFLDIVRDPFSEPYDLSVDRDQALALIQRCTTCEARIYAARIVCLVLDEAECLAAVTPPVTEAAADLWLPDDPKGPKCPPR